MMVESEIQELDEATVLGGVSFAAKGFQPVIEAIIELAEHAAKDADQLPARSTTAP